MKLIKFLLVGVANTFLGLAIIYLCMYYLHMEALTSNAAGYSTGIIFGFFANKSWTFEHNGKFSKSLASYLLVLAIAYLANAMTVAGSISNLHVDPYYAQALGIVPYAVIGFLGSRYFAFSNEGTSTLHEENSFSDFPKPCRSIDLGIVVPCYNEEAALPETVTQLTDLFIMMKKDGLISDKSHIYFVDDGSKDATWNMIEGFAQLNSCVKGIKLSRNQGHQNALLAGLFTAEGEAVISIDADLQDDLRAIPKMIRAFAAGYDIVYGVRRNRDADSFLKRGTALGYYKLLSTLGVDIVFNHADYRLMSRRAIDSLTAFSEVNLFLRGIIPQLGFPSTSVYYDRAKRLAGESKYPMTKMLAFAWQGVTSFSAVPLRAITGIGGIVSVGTFIVTVWAIWVRFFTDKAVPGWASTVLPIYFLSGIQLMCIGVVGEYLAKIYLETKRRPLFFIEKKAP